MRLSRDSRENAAWAEQFQQRAQQRIAALAEEAVDSMGGIVWANDPDYDTLEDLVAYLREYAANFFAETCVNVRFDLPNKLPVHEVSGFFRRHVVMFLKEALQNVSKHADANQVSIRLVLREGEFEMDVCDNGRGLVVSQSEQSGNGLANMQHRIRELSGRFEIQSHPGGGTRVRAVVPLR